MIPLKRSVDNKVSEKTLEKYLRELRKSYNYSQEFIASQLNITRQTYSHYETGRITPPVNSLHNLAKLYNIPLNNFLDFLISDQNTPVKPEPEIPAHPEESSTDAELDEFLRYISTPENDKKFRSLKRQEKLFLYYYQMLDDRDRKDILDFMKVKHQNRQTTQKIRCPH
ncbi:MAG: helix-turn-helix domain-containing protein [Roseburia sp.]|nr:helix-turn-helix domain-containing protein [Roseburia sp.]